MIIKQQNNGHKKWNGIFVNKLINFMSGL